MRFRQIHLHQQRGLVLFVALIALVALSLAGVALIRSVDTSTLIAGNLAFRQGATSSGDSGPESAIAWLTATAAGTTLDPWVSASHPLNMDNAAVGYFSSADGFSLFEESTWSSSHSAPATGTNFDSTGLDLTTGNTVRYVVERMCRNANQVLTESNCMFSDNSEDNNTKIVKGTGSAGMLASTASSPVYRITARITGPRNTVSYIQTFTY